MPLRLHYHPLSSCCHKVLVALYELGVPFEGAFVDFGDAAVRERFLALSPAGKMPLLVDGDEVVPETSIIIEHLVLHHAPASQVLLPRDPAAALEVRLMDRLLDFYVMTPMQAIVADHLRPVGERDRRGVEKQRDTLAMAYRLLEQRLDGRRWMAGADFTLADCAAAPSLFYATTLVPLLPTQPRLAAYLEALLQRPSVARVLDEARPFFRFYPFRDLLPDAYRPAPHTDG